MKVLIVGSGGREHVLAWKIARESRVKEVFVAPGNGGTTWPAEKGRASSENVPIAVSDITGLCNYALEFHIDLTIVGPEAPLADGIVDAFHKQGLRIFGPNAAAAQIEASKVFAKRFMDDMGIPTAKYQVFTDYNEAMAYLAAVHPDGRVVVKASGLAAGKGVVVCSGLGQAQAAVKLMLRDNAFGAAGDEVIVEERLEGDELSLLAFTDGKTVASLVPARDHKRINDGDDGPNTGGMGAFAPVPGIDSALVEQITTDILQPTVSGMAAAGMPYIGVLYAGLMLTADGPRMLEYNCRFGDPEAQVVLPLLKTDLVEIVLACLRGELDQLSIETLSEYCATVVMASPGYPSSYPTGLPIHGVDTAAGLPQTAVFHAGTARQQGALKTSGGRVLAVSGRGTTLEEAVERAYEGIAQIEFEGAHYRTDIGRFSLT